MTGWRREERDQFVRTYLYYGYIPRLLPSIDSLPWARVRRDRTLERAAIGELVERGAGAFREGFRSIPSALHVVPLSGGLDSRAILAELVKHVDAREIVAVTVGTPGTLDFEIPALIARHAGVVHERIDLNQVPFDRARLEQTSMASASPTWVFDSFYNRLMREHFGADAVYWSGFIGSRLTGRKHLPDIASDWESVVAEFAKRNRWLNSTDFLEPGFDPRTILPQEPIHPDSDLDSYEQLDLSVRQMCLVAPVNVPDGYTHRVPFMESAWVQFILGVPGRYRDGQSLYHRILLAAYPTWFALPTKGRVGLSLDPTITEYLANLAARTQRTIRRRLGLAGAPPQTNYIDFGQALRTRDDLRSLTRSSLNRLGEADLVPWIDMERLWIEHDRGRKDHTTALLLLASLEHHLTARGGLVPRAA